MGMRTDMKVSTSNAAKLIVQVLHDEKIPFFLFDKAFREAKELANEYTTPYSPKKLDAIVSATLANKVSDAESKQD